MKLVQGFILVVAFSCAAALAPQLTCTHEVVRMPTDWITMADPCVQKMRDQVQQELIAAMTYLAMGAHFSRDTVNRPGFAKFFFESANEEREHALKLIDQLLMRGELTSEVGKLIRNPMPLNETWEDAVTALKEALKLETRVTQKIRNIIKVCEDPEPGEESFNDYYLVDYLSGEFLEEQYKGQRELAGMISELSKMMKTHGAIGEFLYDKKILNGQLLKS